MGEIWLGTSGWSYKEWIGPFYRDAKESKFSTYSRVFRTAEIDSTFYTYPSRGTIIGLLRYAKPGFIFTAKLPKLITHEKGLDRDQGVGEDVKNFCDLMRPLLLSGKLGCLLIQLPPRFGIEHMETVEGFLEMLPPEFKFAIEFREVSWLCDETWKLLSKYGVAYTIVDEPLLPPELKVTTNFAYFRWHGKGSRPWYNYRYKTSELEPWVPKVKDVANKVERVFGYFNNHYHGYAVENCLEVLGMLGPLTQDQARAKATVQKYLESTLKEGGAIPKKQAKLTDYNKEDLLSQFMDKSRLKRARDIDDRELTIEECSENKIVASIRGYNIVIDNQRREVLHDCRDWDRCMQEGEFCKHIGKLMLSLDDTIAKRTLESIYSERDLWKFGPYLK